MKRQTLGKMIASLRKAQGMTQADLAEKMCVTDKAVSKWERDLSCPDVNTLSRLAEVLGVSVEELISGKPAGEGAPKAEKVQQIIDTALKGVAIAAGIAVVVLGVLRQIDTQSALVLLGIGLACLGISALTDEKE